MIENIFFVVTIYLTVPFNVLHFAQIRSLTRYKYQLCRDSIGAMCELLLLKAAIIGLDKPLWFRDIISLVFTRDLLTSLDKVI